MRVSDAASRASSRKTAGRPISPLVMRPCHSRRPEPPSSVDATGTTPPRFPLPKPPAPCNPPAEPPLASPSCARSSSGGRRTSLLAHGCVRGQVHAFSSNKKTGLSTPGQSRIRSVRSPLRRGPLLATPIATPLVVVVFHNKNPPTPCLWQAPASTQKTKSPRPCTPHRAPVGQGPPGPGWLAISVGFWSGQALATGTAWAGLCLRLFHEKRLSARRLAYAPCL